MPSRTRHHRSRIRLSFSLASGLVIGLALVTAPTLHGTAVAQETRPEQREAIHWAYSSFMGTGFYRISGERQVFVLDLPLAWDWRDPDLAASGPDRTGIRIEFPFTLGLHRLNPFDNLLDFNNFGTVSFTPGIDLMHPVSERWKLGAYAHAGWGTETSGDEHAWLYDVGLKSHVAFRSGKLEWGLFSEAFWAGYDPDDGPAGSLGGLGVGLDGVQPTSWRANDGTALALAWDVTYRWYADTLTFRSREGPTTSVDDEWRVSVALARVDGPIRIGFLAFDQLGLSYRVDSDGRFRGLSVNVSAPFSR